MCWSFTYALQVILVLRWEEWRICVVRGVYIQLGGECVLGRYTETGWKSAKGKSWGGGWHTRVCCGSVSVWKLCMGVCVFVVGVLFLFLVCLQSRGCISSALRVSGLQQCHLLSCFDSDSASLTHCWITGGKRARRGWRWTPTRPLTCKEKTRN